jgi:uncharacterized membrane protein
MNDAHVHLITNHLPIIIPLIALMVLIIGLFSKSDAVKRTAFFLFILGAISTFPAFESGEGAEEIIEHLVGVSHDLIHEHEEKAELFMILSYLLGAISLVGIWANWKKKKFASIIAYVTILFSLIVLFVAKETATTGGEIRHPEIRTTFKKGAYTHKEEHEEN